MTAALAATIRRHVEALAPPPRAVLVNPHDLRAIRDELEDVHRARPNRIWILSDPTVPKGCYKLRTMPAD